MGTNLRVIAPSRRKPLPGDVFVLQLPDESFIPGRVIAVDVVAAGFPGAILIYIFRSREQQPDVPPVESLRATELLVPPILTNRLPWSRGYFQTLANLPLVEGEVLSQHCFRSSQGRYFDETATELPVPVEPCGDWSLQSFRTIDDQVSDAFWIPRAPDL